MLYIVFSVNLDLFSVADDIDEMDDLEHTNGDKDEVHITSIYEPKYKDICK